MIYGNDVYICLILQNRFRYFHDKQICFEVNIYLYTNFVRRRFRGSSKTVSPKTDSMSRTNGVQGLQGFELLVECSYAAREAVIQVDDLEDLLLRDEPQFATEVNMVRDALVLLRTVADALHAARTDARAEAQQALQGSADK